MSLKEDFQRAIAQSQQGKSVGTAIKRTNFSTRSIPDLKDMLIGKFIQFAMESDDPRRYDSGKVQITGIEHLSDSVYGKGLKITFVKPWASTTSAWMFVDYKHLPELLEKGVVLFKAKDSFKKEMLRVTLYDD